MNIYKGSILEIAYSSRLHNLVNTYISALRLSGIYFNVGWRLKAPIVFLTPTECHDFSAP